MRLYKIFVTDVYSGYQGKYGVSTKDLTKESCVVLFEDGTYCALRPDQVQVTCFVDDPFGLDELIASVTDEKRELEDRIATMLKPGALVAETSKSPFETLFGLKPSSINIDFQKEK